MSKLAIKGGKPVRTKGWTEWPIYDNTEIEGIMEVIKSRCWCALPYIFAGKGKSMEESKVEQLEKAFAEYHNAKHGIAVNGGSSALLISYAAAGVRSGDEVIMPPRTFVSTATAALYLNAIPIFVDVEEETLLIDPDKIEEAITDRTRAIVPVHCGGYPCDMDRIMEIAEKHNLMVIADACHAHGSEWKGKKVASISHLSAFSFQQGKNMTCGDGGMIVTNDDELAAKCCELVISGGRSRAGEPADIIFNLRMSEFEGAIALAQFGRLDAQIEIKEANVAYLKERLEKIGGIRFPKRDERITRMPHLYPSLKYDQDALGGVPASTFAQALSAEGIPCGALTEARALYQYPLFAEKRFDQRILELYGKDIDYNEVSCPVCEGYAGKWLRFDHAMLLGAEEDMEDFARAVEKIKENLKELK